MKYQIVDKLKFEYGVVDICKYLQCSRSGYYDWIKRDKPTHNRLDEYKLAIISKLHNERKTLGRRQIQMQLESKYNLHMSLGSVHRYMTILNIKSMRKKKYLPQKNNKQNIIHSFPNILKQNFHPIQNQEILLTDITYIPCKNGRLYLSAVKNMRDKSIAAYHYSDKNDVDLVMKTFQNIKLKKMSRYIVHSDQGSQYTSLEYQKYIISNEITGSMSRKGVPYDNSPMESFFSIFKNEELKLYRKQTKREMGIIIDNFIYYYNFERPQIGLKKLTPIKYRDQFIKSSN